MFVWLGIHPVSYFWIIKKTEKYIFILRGVFKIFREITIRCFQL